MSTEEGKRSPISTIGQLVKRLVVMISLVFIAICILMFGIFTVPMYLENNYATIGTLPDFLMVALIITGDVGIIGLAVIVILILVDYINV